MKLFQLSSVSLIRKYIGFFDILLAPSDKLTIISDSNEINKSREAMKKHVSQYVWFRKLFIYFSSYLIINSLIPVNYEQKNWYKQEKKQKKKQTFV